MKLLLKRILPQSYKTLILKTIELPDLVFMLFFKKNRFLASIYYLFLSRQFRREHQAVLAGRAAYQKSLKDVGATSVLLRRNIHRLEKGLIMQPRRNVFAENFIGETVKVYQRAIVQDTLIPDEEKWVTDVLNEYFSVVKDTKIIANARMKFNLSVRERNTTKDKKFIPYSFDTLPKSSIEYDDLYKLFSRRRSIRWYKDKEVPIELIEKAVDLATLAPSACNRQPYSFYVSINKSDAVKVAKCAGGTPGWAENIPCTIVIVGDLSAYSKERDRHLIYIDSSLAAMQLMLALETLGLSSCSINWPEVEGPEEKMKKLLNLKPYERPIMLLSVGYGKDKGGVPFSQKKSSKVLIKKI